MLKFSKFLNESDDKYAPHGLDRKEIKEKVKFHRNEGFKLEDESKKHLKTSKEHRQLKNDATHHFNAANSYEYAHDSMKYGHSPSSVKGKIKSAENHASKVSGKIPEVAKPKAKIKNIHDHVHGILTAKGFSHSSESYDDHNTYQRRSTPYGDDRSFAQKSSRKITTHKYALKGTQQGATALKAHLKKEGVLGERGNHRIHVMHDKGTIHVTHSVSGKSIPDHKYNEKEYNYQTAAHLDHPSMGTRYSDWRKSR